MKTCRTEGPCSRSECDCGFYDKDHPMTARHSLDQIVLGLDGVTAGPERIWLQSYEDSTAVGEDRLWCEDKVWPNSPEDHEPTEYVRADLFRALERERDEALEHSRDYPAISARLHDREKARDAEQAACREAIARATAAEATVTALQEALAKAAEALEKFTGHYEPWMDRWADDAESSTFSRHTFGQLRSARAIISQIRSEK